MMQMCLLIAQRLRPSMDMDTWQELWDAYTPGEELDNELTSELDRMGVDPEADMYEETAEDKAFVADDDEVEYEEDEEEAEEGEEEEEEEDEERDEELRKREAKRIISKKLPPKALPKTAADIRKSASEIRNQQIDKTKEKKDRMDILCDEDGEDDEDDEDYKDGEEGRQMKQQAHIFPRIR